MLGRYKMQAQIDRVLARYGVSGPGREWLIRALHPSSEGVSPGLPDESAQCVLRPEYRVQTTIPPNTYSNQYDCMVWTVPGDVNAAFWATGPSPTDFTITDFPPGGQLGVLPLQTFADINAQYSTVQFVSASAPTINALSQSRATNIPTAFRHQYKSLTAHLICSDLTNQGEVYSAQFSPIPVAKTGQIGVQTNATNSLPNCFVGSTVFVPGNEAQMTTMAPDCYVGAAKDGVYIPHRLCGPTQPFAHTELPYCLNSLTINNTPALITGMTYGGMSYTNQAVLGLPGAMYCTQYTQGPISFGGSAFPWINQVWNQVTEPFRSGYDTGYDNMNVSVTIFRGLTSSTGVGGVGGASIMLKAVCGLEVVTAPSSPDRVFCKPAACYDPRALEAYYAASLELRDAYPASYNAFGSLLSVLADVGARVWPYVRPVLSSVADRAADALRDGPASAAVASAPTKARVAIKPQPKQARKKRKPKKMRG